MNPVVEFHSSGVLRYGIDPKHNDLKLVLEIDPGIAETYRALVPKFVRLNRPKFAPHISVVRHESVPVARMSVWAKHEGCSIDFTYLSTIYNDETYYWLRCYSLDLIEVRRELGLPDLSEMARPPDLADCFHTTIGNTKLV